MKIYFDDITRIASSNCEHLSKNDDTNYWLTSPGTRLKQELQYLGIPYYSIDSIDEPGLYFIEVNGDPHWWGGLAPGLFTPPHILSKLPDNIIDLVRKKQLRLIISADREGGGMIYEKRDVFLATTLEMQRLNLPAESILITQGNKKISEQYDQWLMETSNKKLFEVKHINHFDRIFVDSVDNFPLIPVVKTSIENTNCLDFNSLNRTYKEHRIAHLYHLAKNGMLQNGLVSANEIRTHQLSVLSILQNSITMAEVDSVICENYPKFVDGDWSTNNAANSINTDIFKNSLISFVTETKFNEDVVFLTEKVFKTLSFGHPMIVLGSCGILDALRDMGYKTDWCGIDPSYNNIKDNSTRFYKTHEVLNNWIQLSRKEKIKKIIDSLPTIEHNMQVSRNNNFYHSDLIDAINTSRNYFNDRF
jgi:hypothetical protein